MSSKSNTGQEPDPLVDGTSEVLECKGVDVGAAGGCSGWLRAILKFGPFVTFDRRRRKDTIPMLASSCIFRE